VEERPFKGRARAPRMSRGYLLNSLFMLPKTTRAWWLSLLLACTYLPVCGQSQLVGKIEEQNTTANHIVHVGGDVTAPKAIYSPEPEFSEAARKAGYQGTCLLSLIVGADGRPRDIRVVRKLGMQLDEKAIQALSEWKFEPAQKGGKPVAVAMQVEFSFHLDRNGGSKQMFSAEQYEQMREARTPIQSQIYRTSGGEEPLVCPQSSSDREGPSITITDLIFDGDLNMPSVDRDRIAASIKQGIYSGGGDEVATEVSERVQGAWQNSGYFTAQAHTDTRLLTSGPSSERMAATVHVDEGQQFRLAGIRFKNNRAISDVAVLRSFFTIKDGDIFSRDAIERGMQDLRRAYGEFGYINLSSVPTTRVHEQQQKVSVDIDLDESKQFYVSRIDVVGLDEAAFQNVLRDMITKPGDIYNQRLVELFLQNYVSHLPAYASFEPRYELHMDETAGTVAMTYDFRHCHAD
jgi:TonB family protein